MIINKTNGKIIANNAVICKSFFSKAKGLMFKRQFVDCGYVFEFRKEIIGSIHMLFVFFPIDIVWLDKENRVIEIKENIKPFTPSIIPRNKCKSFIEIPVNTIKNKNIKINDKIEINL